ncbi:hypothetical protein SprV_0702309300 [Sparganum proliferum]
MRPIRSANAQPLPTCPRCKRTFGAQIGPIAHLRINCTSRKAPTVVPLLASSSSSSPPTNSDCASEPPLPSSSSSSSSSSSAPTSGVLAAVAHNTTHTPDTTSDITSATSDCPGDDQDYTCPHCDRTFTSHIGLVGHLRIYRAEAGDPVPGAPTYTHRTCLYCPHCPRTFTYCMGLFGHMRIHKRVIDRSSETPTTSNTLNITPRPTLVSSPCAPITTTASSAADADTADYSCPDCPLTFSSRIGLVSHLLILRTEIGELVPGAPTYTHRTQLHCPHCLRIFTHRMGLFGHMHNRPVASRHHTLPP